MGCEFFKWLATREIFVSIRAIQMDEHFGSRIPIQMRSQVVHAQQPEEWELLIHTPETRPTPGKKSVFFTMFECSELAPPYVSMLNFAEIVIVPCRWNAVHFAESGVKKPIHVVPLGVDPEIFKPSPMVVGGPCVFGVAGRTAHCAKRKAIQESIDLFVKTFPREQHDDVRLHVKIHEDCKIVDPKDHRVKITREHLEGYQLERWLSGLTAFVSLARAEGFGLWQLQAMACGRPVVACKYSGLADFLLDDYAIPYKQVPADSYGSEVNVDYRGMWAQPDMATAEKLLRRIHTEHKKKPQLLVEAGQRAAEAAKPFTWEASTDKLIVILQEVGAL